MGDMMQGFLMAFVCIAAVLLFILAILHSPPTHGLYRFQDNIEKCAKAGGSYESCFNLFKEENDQ